MSKIPMSRPAQSVSAPAENTVGPSWKPIIIYTALAFGLGWMMFIPGLLLNAGPTTLIGTIFSTTFMWTPAVAAAAVVRFIEKKPLFSTLKISLKGVWRKTLLWSLLSIPIAFILILASLGSSALLGTYHFDLMNLSEFQKVLEASGQTGLTTSQVWDAFWPRIAGVIPMLFLAGMVGALGEEIGWHAWLYPRLRDRLGVTASLALTAIIWGLWHAPAILLGHNYPDNPQLGVLMFIITCAGLTIPIQLLMNWGGSVWAAASAHAAINAIAPALLIFAPLNDVNHPYDPVAAAFTGGGGWPVVAILFIAGAIILKRDNTSQPSTPAAG